MRPKRMFLETRNGRTLEVEENLLNQFATVFEIPVTMFSLKQMQRGHFKLGQDDLVAGTIQAVKAALKQYGKELVEHSPYPVCLQHLLYREVKWVRTLRDAKDMLDKGASFFIKPAGYKHFTGFVASFSDDHRFYGASGQLPVFISTPVQFVSEWRCYVADGKLLDVRLADPDHDRSVVPDYAVIEEAVKQLTHFGAPAGYAVDFGVLTTGETALVELNDGFSIGAYDGIPCDLYWQVIYSRWKELIAE